MLQIINIIGFYITAFIDFIVKTFGYVGVGAIIFAESGLCLGFILPRDSFLFLTGFLASQNYFNIIILFFVIFFTAVLGDNTGYFLGRKLGRKVFEMDNSFISNFKNLKKTENFFIRYGKMTFWYSVLCQLLGRLLHYLAGLEKWIINYFLYQTLLDVLSGVL